MLLSSKIRHFKKVFKVILFGALIAACTQTPHVTPAATLTKSASPSITAQATVTSVPSASPTVSTSVVILVAPEQADPYQVSSLQAALKELAASSGLSFRLTTTLVSGDLDASIKVVVALQSDPGLAGLVKDAPIVQFLAVGIPGLQTGPNLSLIGPEGFHPDQQAFMAGYVAAISTIGWRVGVLTQGETNGGQLVQNAFINGVRFFCGLCGPPFRVYPQAFAIASPGDESSWRASADNLLHGAVTTVYVSPVSSSPALLTYLYQAKVNLIGGQAPTDDLRSQWIATILPDPTSALKQLWPDLIAGKGGRQMPMPLVLADTSSGLLSAARLRLVDATLEKVVTGLIQPNPVPEP